VTVTETTVEELDLAREQVTRAAQGTDDPTAALAGLLAGRRHLDSGLTR